MFENSLITGEASKAQGRASRAAGASRAGTGHCLIRVSSVQNFWYVSPIDVDPYLEVQGSYSQAIIVVINHR